MRTDDYSQIQIWNLAIAQRKLGITSGGVPLTRQINTTAPLTGGGNLTVDLTLAIAQATAAIDGYLSSGDFASFAAKEAALTFTAPLSRALDTISIPNSSAVADGYLSSVNFAIFAAKVSSVSGNSPIASSGGTTPAISIADALADGATKGAAAFTASDFNSAAGVISIDYAGGQGASAINKGFLSSTDWNTFNSKVAASRSISTTAPLTGGGDLSADRTLAISAATATSAGSQSAASFIASNSIVAMLRGGIYLS